jgi:hypothetical protein
MGCFLKSMAILTGIAAILVSLLLIAWSVFFIRKPYSGYVFSLLIVALFLFGGGMAGPVLMGLVLSWAVFRINAQQSPAESPKQIWLRLQGLWRIVLPLSMVSWLSLWPGLIILGAMGVVPPAATVYFLSLLSFATFLLAIFSAIAGDKLAIAEVEQSI